MGSIATIGKEMVLTTLRNMASQTKWRFDEKIIDVVERYFEDQKSIQNISPELFDLAFTIFDDLLDPVRHKEVIEDIDELKKKHFVE